MTPEPSELRRLRERFGWSIEDHAALGEGWWVGPREIPTTAFSTATLQMLLEVEDRSLWFRLRNELIGDVLRRVGVPTALWEIGAGNGVVAKYLAGMGIAAVAIEPSAAGAAGAASRGIELVVQSRFEELRLPEASLPAVGAFDVLEHLPEPDSLLTEVRRVLAPNGIFVATVPAIPVLWSQADEVAGHYRRYRRDTLTALLAGTGFRTDYLNHHFVGALPQLALRALPWRLGVRRDEAAAMAKYCDELGRQSGVVEAVGERLMRWERAWSRRHRVPAGTSLIVAARRIDDPPST